MYGWTRDDFPLIFIVKDRLLYWSTTPLPNVFTLVEKEECVCVFPWHIAHLKHRLQLFVKEHPIVCYP